LKASATGFEAGPRKLEPFVGFFYKILHFFMDTFKIQEGGVQIELGKLMN